MWEFVEKVVYINLAKRTDRNEHMKRVTSVFGDKVIRFEAIQDTPGYLGCARSHIEVLKMAIKYRWNNVLILEDDAEWNNLEANYAQLEELIQQPYDVILLSGGCVSADSNKRLHSSQTATAYLVHSNYYTTLLENFTEGYQHQKQSSEYGQYALDQYWKRLQSRDKWYITLPLLMYQRPDFSDIEGQFVDYRDMNLLNFKTN